MFMYIPSMDNVRVHMYIYKMRAMVHGHTHVEARDVTDKECLKQQSRDH